MHEPRERLALDLEAAHELRGAIPRTQHLERDRLSIGAVGALRTIDVPHAAGADQRDDAVWPHARIGVEATVEGGRASVSGRDTSFGDQAYVLLVGLQHCLDFATNGEI